MSCLSINDYLSPARISAPIAPPEPTPVKLRRKSLIARRLEERSRIPWWVHPDDPENEDRQDQARANMGAFDQLGAQTRAAIAGSRFDIPADMVRQQWGGPYAEDERVADRVRKHDDKYSGSFGPAYPTGI